MNFNDVFADVINYGLFNGETVLDEKTLEDKHPSEVIKTSKGQNSEKIRDVYKICNNLSGRRVYLGLETSSIPMTGCL